MQNEDLTKDEKVILNLILKNTQIDHNNPPKSKPFLGSSKQLGKAANINNRKRVRQALTSLKEKGFLEQCKYEIEGKGYTKKGYRLTKVF